MDVRRSAILAWPVVGLAIAAWVTGLGLAYSGPSSAPPIPLDGLVWATPYLAFAAIGGLITVRKPGNRIGWLLVGVSLLQGIGILGTSIVRYLFAWNPSPGAAGWLELAAGSLSVVSYGLLIFVVLTFPSGRLPSPRWRWLAGIVVLFLGVSVADLAVSPLPSLPIGLPVSPISNRDLARLLDPLASQPVNALLYLAAASSLPFRYRAGGKVVRQQIKWFGLGVAVLVTFSVANGLGPILVGRQSPTSIWSFVGTIVQSVGLMGVPAAIGIAILRHRLFDIDLIISRALTYGALALLATAIYVVLVVGAGTILGRTAGTNLVLSIVATAFVAVAFQPARQWLDAAANRLVYGRRQAPYESLTGFTRGLAGNYSVGEVLPRMVEVIAHGLRCRAAAVRLDKDSAQAAARWPLDAQLPADPPSQVVEILHQGERHGSLAVWTHAGEELNANELRVLSDLALQAGLILHNARLSAELQRRLEELTASRLRLVSAQDHERRRLERDLHDGAQHDLVALRMKLGLAEGMARTSGSQLATVLSELREDTATTLENIRRLSRGLYPPLLESQGLAAALTAHARRLPIPAHVRASERRFSYDVETAVYFCCVEALQNAAKHACAHQAWISIDEQDGHLRFEIGDDGQGFDIARSDAGSGLQNIRDRVDALGGILLINTGPGGTLVEGSIPLAV
ncbi:MAG TPA: histidine kinase [Candidatus Dormibacteraeota bacterium]|nr:histidine kinase [Candidatus Dormibacteraeota bacterium]